MEKTKLKIFCLSGPLLSTEWASIMGDKYQHHMNFEPVLVGNISDAQVIVWDGVLTPKSGPVFSQLLDDIHEQVVFLITGEAATLYHDHPFVKLSDRMNGAVHLSPSRTLPEEILEALDECQKRLTHV
jgi:hypothetical protein